MYGKKQTSQKSATPSPQSIAKAQRLVQQNPRCKAKAREAYRQAAGGGVVVRSVPRGADGHSRPSSRRITSDPRIVKKSGKNRYASHNVGGKNFSVRYTTEPPGPWSQGVSEHVVHERISKGRPNPLCRGQFLLGEVIFVSNVVGTPCFVLPLHPNSLGGLPGVLARQYGRFRFRNLRIKYCPVVAVTEPGAILIAFSDSPSLYLTDGVDLVQTLSSTPGYRQTNVWEASESNFHFDLSDQRQWRPTIESDIDPTDLTQGTLYIASANSLTASQQYGNAYLEYEVEFEEPLVTAIELPVPTTALVFTGTTVTVAEEEALVGISAAAAAGTISTNTPNAIGEDGVYILSGFMNSVSTPPVVTPAGLEATYVISDGNPIFARIERTTRTVAGAPDIYTTLHTTLQSALLPQKFGVVAVDGGTFSLAQDNVGQIILQAQGPVSFSFTVFGQLWQFNDMNP